MSLSTIILPLFMIIPLLSYEKLLLVVENIAYIPDDLYLQNGVSMDSMARLHGAIYNNFDKKRFNEERVCYFTQKWEKECQTFEEKRKAWLLYH